MQLFDKTIESCKLCVSLIGVVSVVAISVTIDPLCAKFAYEVRRIICISQKVRNQNSKEEMFRSIDESHSSLYINNTPNQSHQNEEIIRSKIKINSELSSSCY